MKFKYTLLISIFVVLGAHVQQAMSQNALNIYTTNSTDKNIQFNLIRKITFSGTDLVLNYAAGSTENVSMSLIKKMTFGVSTGITDNYADTQSFSVYPNPTSDFLYFKNLPENSTAITVYSINGLKVLNVSAGLGRLDISKLAKGIYFIKINNQVSKFTKL